MLCNICVDILQYNYLKIVVYLAATFVFLPLILHCKLCELHTLLGLNKSLAGMKGFRKRVLIHIISLIPYSGPARQCCYDEQGRLIIGPTAGGHSDTSSVYSQIIPPSVAMTIHLQQDITPFIQCCKSTEPSCTNFFSFRPSAESECQYNPPPPGMF